MKKREFTFLGITSLLLVLVGVFFIYFNKTPSSQKTNNEDKTIIQETTPQKNPSEIYLVLKNKNLKKDSVFEVEIVLDSKQNTINGADVSLNFDPQILQIVDSNSNKVGIQVLAGEIFESPMVLQNKADNQQGIIDLSLGTLTPFKGKGVYGLIRFKALQAGKATINFDHSKTKIAVLDETTSYQGSQNLTPLELEIEN